MSGAFYLAIVALILAVGFAAAIVVLWRHTCTCAHEEREDWRRDR